MLARQDRLRRMRDFALLSQKGRVVFGPLFTLRFRPSELSTRIGFVASTKLFKRANKRNRVKRRMRAALREVTAEWPKQFDLLFIIKPEVLTEDFQVILAAVRRSFEKMPEAMTQAPRPRPLKAKRKTSVVYTEKS